MKNNRALIFFLVLMSVGFSSFSNSLYQVGQSTRSVAMGGTYISFVRGVDSLFYNAAALARVEGFSFTLAELQPAVGGNSETLADDFSGGDSGATTASDLDSFYGNTYVVDVNARGGIVLPYFGFGAYSSNYLKQKFNNPVFPTYNVEFISDYGYLVAGAIPLGPNVSFGIAGRHIKRWGDETELFVTSLLGNDQVETVKNSILARGTGNALDLSLLATFAGDWNPSAAFVWNDIGNTKFNPTAGSGSPQQENNLIFGASVQRTLPVGTITSAIEYKYIQQPGSLSKKLHLGTEFSSGIFNLRAGLYQGYLTYGAGLDFSFLRIEAAQYAVEMGEAAGQERSDRYQASVSLNLDFDQAFKLQTGEGKKRRLMQRR